eukprot:scaffold4562_cov255-Pinguiococcus_pyrenoidosus.AAC.17
MKLLQQLFHLYKSGEERDAQRIAHGLSSAAVVRKLGDVAPMKHANQATSNSLDGRSAPGIDPLTLNRGFESPARGGGDDPLAAMPGLGRMLPDDGSVALKHNGVPWRPPQAERIAPNLLQQIPKDRRVLLRADLQHAHGLVGTEVQRQQPGRHTPFHPNLFALQPHVDNGIRGRLPLERRRERQDEEAIRMHPNCSSLLQGFTRVLNGIWKGPFLRVKSHERSRPTNVGRSIWRAWIAERDRRTNPAAIRASPSIP